MKINQTKAKKIVFFESILAAFFFSSTLYFWFLQPLNFISKQRLLLAFILWLLLTPALFFVFSFFHKKHILNQHNLSQNNLIFCIIFSFIASVFINLIFIDKNHIPYNLLFLPKQNITIEIKSSEYQKNIEITGFYNGLAPVSYSSFKLNGDWQTVDQATLIHSGKESASIEYSGWMVEKHYLEFRKNPEGGEAVIHWNDSVEYINLYGKDTQKLRFDYPFPIPSLSRNSVLFLTIISIFVIIFPFIQILVDKLSNDRDLIKFDLWFVETTSGLQKFTLITSIVCGMATITLFLAPFINTDKESKQIQKNSSGDLPNIFVIIVDALGAEDMSLFGYHLDTTPNLNKITQDWSVYTNAQSPSVCSIGVYPSLVTGHYPYIMRPFAQYGDQIRSSDSWIDLFQVLNDYGYNTYWSGYLPPGFYHTGSGVNYTFGMPYPAQLLDSWFQPKGIRKKYFPYIPFSIQQPENYSSSQFSDYRLSQTTQLLEKDTFQSPFFLYLHYDGVHVMPGIEWIYPTGSYYGTFLPANDSGLRLRYDEAILNQDYQINEFITELKSKGLYEKSMIILLADHGQVIKEGSLTQCSMLVSLEETHVPLLIKYPFQKKGEIHSNIVSTIDITPTIFDLLGIKYESTWFDGKSLLNNEANQIENRYIFSGNTFSELYKNYISIMDNQYKLVLRNNQYFLYDYKNDPAEENDLFNSFGKDNPIVRSMMEALNFHRNKIFD